AAWRSSRALAMAWRSLARSSAVALAASARALTFASISARALAAVFMRSENFWSSRSAMRVLVVEEASEFAGTGGMLELAQRFGFDLANTLAGDAELLAHLFQRVIGVHADAEAHAQHTLFARSKRGQNPRGGFAQIGLDGGIDGQDHIGVLDEVAQM